MFNFRSSTLKSPEFLLTLSNNFLLLLGMLFFGWTFFETLFLFWLEPIAALMVLFYLRIIIPLKFDPPSIKQNPVYQKSVAKTIALAIYTLIMSYITLVFIINLCQIDGWDTTQGIFHTLAQMPMYLWQGSLFFLTILFLLVFLIPPIMIERQGVRPSDNRLPMQSQLLIYPWQFVANFVWFAILYLSSSYITSNEVLLVLIMAICKSIFEIIIYLHIDWNNL